MLLKSEDLKITIQYRDEIYTHKHKYVFIYNTDRILQKN